MENQGQATPSAVDLMVSDLAERVAQTSVEASSWKARALLAEKALKDLKDAEGVEAEQVEVGETGPELVALPDPEEE